MKEPRKSHERVGSPPERALLVFDGDCGFCRKWVERWRGATRGRVDYAPSQEAAARFPEIPAEEFTRSVQFIEADGTVTSGAEAVFRALAYARAGGIALWVYERIPGAAAISEWCYALVARRRVLFSKITRALWGAHLERPAYLASRCVFLRLIGLVYLTAFASLWMQIDGLAGSRGIVPAASWLEAVRAATGPGRYWWVPTLCWLGASDGALHLLCGGGVVVSLLMLFGVAPAACAVLLWLFYLSLASVCGVFLGFQWDNLLLEAGFLAIFLAPLSLRCRLPCASAPSRLWLALTRWLLFRLMFSSGAVKLLATDRRGGSAWRDLTALTYHYETQPLPTWIAWYAHHLPVWFHKASTIAMFFIELVVPFFIFAPRRVRLAAFGLLAGFQLVIAATGNYTFFNLLTLVLCVLLLDDSVWPGKRRGVWNPAEAGPAGSLASANGLSAITSTAQPQPTGRPAPSPGANSRGAGRWAGWISAPIAAVVLIASTVEMAGTLRLGLDWPRPVAQLMETISPLRSVNSYGLFAVMTTSRPEIIVEGSDDGKTWLPYEFRWKPGDLGRRPRFVAPHQPRLDWQMWFAALGEARSNPWVSAFLARLLEGSPDVLALLASNPFPTHPPRYIRALSYDYHFTGAAARREDGAWWRREPIGVYFPPASLRGRRPGEDGAAQDGDRKNSQ